MLARLILTGLVLLVAGTGLAKPTVVASIAPYGDLLEQIAGGDAEVLVVLPTGASPHTFEPTPRTAAALAGADLVVMNGGVDEWLHDLLEAADVHVPVIEALEALEGILSGQWRADDEDPEVGAAVGYDHAMHDDAGHDDADHETDAEHRHHNQHAGRNPHIWLDPSLMAELVGAIGEGLAQVDPSRRESYLQRAEALRLELIELDGELQELLAPLAGAPFIPFHDAWPYFADRYDLDLLLEIEPFPGREPSPRYLADAVRTIRASGAPAIFNEAGLSDRPARVLAAEAGVELFLLDPLGSTAESYQELMRRNAATIVEALAPWRKR